jgi:hypothetical protein
MKKPNLQLDIVWEQQAAPDATERLLAAFEMLFKDTVIEVPQDTPI